VTLAHRTRKSDHPPQIGQACHPKQHRHDDGSYPDSDDDGDHECQIRARDERLAGMSNSPSLLGAR
jgi:hypothetical protein